MSLKNIILYLLPRKINIYFYPIEIVNREFNYKKNLSLKISKKPALHIFGHPWILCTLTRFIDKVNWFGQNIFEFNGIFRNSTAEVIRKKKGKIFFIDEEGGVYPKEKSINYFNNRLKKQFFKKGDCIFAWGEEQKKLYDKKGYFAFNLGHPRFSPCKNKTSVDVKKNEILIISSCSILTSSKNYNKELGNERFNSEIINHTEKFSKLLKIVLENINKKIQIRPHPSEDIKLLKKFFRHYKNVNISNINNVLEDIYESKIIYHFNCTTSIEAFTSGIKVINLSKKKYTIIEDLDKNNIYESKWITYPPNKKKIIEIIEKNSVSSFTSPTYIIFIGLLIYFIFLFQLLRPIYRYSMRKGGRYKKPKNFLGLNLIFFRYIK